jgi:anti-sigma factor RsiW
MTERGRTLGCAEARDLAGGYVLHALDPDEEAAVRAHLATCDQAHAEFEELGGVVPGLLELDDLEMIEPPASLGERIMAAAAADLAAHPRAGASPADQAGPAVQPTPSSTREPIGFPSATQRTAGMERARRETSPLDWVLRVAAVLAIVAVGTWGLGIQRQLDDAQRQLAAARAFDQAVARVVDTASLPGATTTVLAPAEGGRGSGIAAVAPDGSVVLAMRDLPATTGSEVYEAWVIRPDEAPQAVGGFTVDDDGIATFTTRPTATPPGATIALTREPNAGSTAPLGPVVSSGVAPAPAGATG